MNREEAILSDIKRLNADLEKIRMAKESNAIMPLDTITNEEKIKVFDNLYEIMLDIVKTTQEYRYIESDSHEFVFDETMAVLNPRKPENILIYFENIF